MASKKIKAEVHVNGDYLQGTEDVTLLITDAQAGAVLEAVVAGYPVIVNLVTTPSNGRKPAENPAAYAEQ